nr:glycerophosphodiester phosphodiesterase family protein [Candidatus Sigynarchaeota archaeon]
MDMCANIITFGHRGAMGHAPENTLLAFKTAVAMGVDGIELDVYRSQDGHVIVSHSDTLDIGGHLYRITKLDLNEIKKIDLGKGQRVPTLDEVIDTMEKLTNKKVLYSIDLKDVRDGDVYHEVVEKGGIKPRLFTCFESRMFIKKMYRQYADLTYVLSIHVNPEGGIEDLDKFDPAMIKVVNIPEKELTKLLVDAIHAKKLKSFVWDVNEEQRMRELAGWGVDGMYSNYPDMLVRVIKKK